MSQPIEMPRWLDLVVLPAFNLALALLVAGLVVLLVGQDPRQVLALLIKGALGSRIGVSYTLYYATTFVFTALAVAVAFQVVRQAPPRQPPAPLPRTPTTTNRRKPARSCTTPPPTFAASRSCAGATRRGPSAQCERR